MNDVDTSKKPSSQSVGSALNPESALIIRPGALGDTLVALPALAGLADKMDVVFVGRRPGLHFLADHVTSVRDFESSGWHGLFAGELPDIRGAVPLPSVAVGFMNDDEGRVRRNLTRLYPGAAVHLFPSLPGETRTGHVARYIAECLSEAGLPVTPDRTMARCRDAPLLAAEMSPGPRTKMVLHPGSGSASKNHPIDFWMGLLKRLRKDVRFGGLTPTVLVGPAETDLLHEWQDAFRGDGVRFAIGTDHAKLGRIMATAGLYIGHDSGISHLAAMYGAPTVALFKSSRVDRWRPLGPRVRVVWSAEAGSGLEKEVIESGRALLKQQRQ